MSINIGEVSSLEEAIGLAAFYILLVVMFMIDPFLSKSGEKEEKGFSVIFVKVCRFVFISYTINYVVGVLCLTVRMIIIRQTYFPEGIDIIVNLPSFVLIFISSVILLGMNDLIGKSYVKLVGSVKAVSDDKEETISGTNQDIPETVST